MLMLEGSNMSDGKFDMIILSPHPDDELLGCYRVIKKGLGKKVAVVYFYGDEGRFEEARNFCREYNMTPIVFDGEERLKELYADEVYIPCKYETHPEHLLVRDLGLICFLGRTNVYEYCIEKVGCSEVSRLSDEEVFEKIGLLEKYYPSQRDVWRNNVRLVFFEGMTPVYDLRVCVRLELDGLHYAPGKLSSWKYLENLHRERFFVEVLVRETKSRQVFFEDLRKNVLDTISPYYDDELKMYNFGEMSCEDIGILVAERLKRCGIMGIIVVRVGESDGSYAEVVI